jgi:predicted LPLAT superfamily acyltransferase
MSGDRRADAATRAAPSGAPSGAKPARGAPAPNGSARHWSSFGEETVVGGMWLLYALYRCAGRAPFRVVLYPVVVWYWATNRRAREASLDYLRRLEAATGAIGHAPGRRETIAHFLSFAETLLDKMLAVGGRYRFDRLRYVGHEAIEAMVRAGQGGLLVTAHMGCLEMCQASAERTPGMKLTVLVHTAHAERFNRMLERLSPGRAVSLLQVTEISPATAVMLAERIARGEFVAIAGDRVPIVAGRASAVAVPFLGHAAPFPTGAYMLAALLKCPLLSLACIRQGDAHEIHLECLAERVVLPRADRLAAAQVHATQFAQRLERLLARAPYEWFNFFSFWDQPGAVAVAPAPDTP